jgi:hypothetical protein
MTTQVEKTVEVDVSVRAAYDQWTQFEEFPQFMGGVQEVRQVSDSLTHWVAQIAGVRREWDAAILEQVPDQKVAWAATTGATNAGAVHFQSLGTTRTLVRLSLEYEPEGLVEKVGDFLNVVEKQAEGDLERFKSFIESRGTATGAWRGAVNEAGTVGTPGVESASASRGDSGKAGVSGTAVAAGLAAGAAAAGAAAAVAANRPSGTGSPSGSESGVEGDPIEIGPTGGERSTLPATAPTTGDIGGVTGSAAPSFDDDPGGGDPVTVDPATGVRGDSAAPDADSSTPGDPTVPRSPRDR